MSIKSKPQIAADMVRELLKLGFNIELVLADSLYGEGGANFIDVLDDLKLEYVVAIRSNQRRLDARRQRRFALQSGSRLSENFPRATPKSALFEKSCMENHKGAIFYIGKSQLMLRNYRAIQPGM